MTAAEIISIKERIKAEFARRNGYGSVDQYTNSIYDFNIMPETGKAILEEHGQKTLDLLLEVGEISNTYKGLKGQIIPPGFNNEQLSNFLTILENDTTGSSCRGGCTATTTALITCRGGWC